MRSEQRDQAYLWDMLDAALAIQGFAQGQILEDYLADRKLRNAVERNLEIIGEAGHRVSSAFREAHVEIPWAAITGQRNILAHEYGEVRHELVWNVVVHDIPALVEMIRAIMATDEDDPQGGRP